MDDSTERWGIGLIEHDLLAELIRLWEGGLSPENLEGIEHALRAWLVSLVLTVVPRRTFSYDRNVPPFGDHLLDYEVTVRPIPPLGVPLGASESDFLLKSVARPFRQLAADSLPPWIKKRGQAFAYWDMWFFGAAQDDCAEAARTMRSTWLNYAEDSEYHDPFTAEDLEGHEVGGFGEARVYAEYLIDAHRSGISMYGSSPLFQLCHQHVFSEWPLQIFASLTEQYMSAARALRGPGLGVDLPPLVGLVLSRASSRQDIPVVLRDLREEYAKARSELWGVLQEMWLAPKFGEQQRLLRKLKSAAQAIFDAAFPDRFDAMEFSIGLAQLSPGGLAQAARTLRQRDKANAIVSGFSFTKKLSRDLRTIDNVRSCLSRHLSASERRAFGM